MDEREKRMKKIRNIMIIVPKGRRRSTPYFLKIKLSF